MSISFFILAGVLLLMLWMHKVEVHQFQINRHAVRLQKPLRSALTLLHLSDIHFARPNPAMARFFDRLATETYDLIVLTGDIIDCPEGVALAREHLSKLRSRYGFFAVFGNHDYYDYRTKDAFLHNFPGQQHPKNLNPADDLQRVLEEAGIVVMRNETRELETAAGPLLVHGLDDPTTGRASIRKTLENYDAEKINLLLTHSIDAFYDISEGEIDLSFSGHSHGGQVRLPWIGPLVTHTTMGRRYASGIMTVKGAVCCVSRGVGYGRVLPFRLLCPPEAVVLTVSGA